MSRFTWIPLRSIVLQGLSVEEGELTQALDIESLQERNASELRRLAKRLTRLLVMILFEVGHTKVLSNNILGMQKGMNGEMLKDILQDADKQTKRRLSRTDPELEPVIDAIENGSWGRRKACLPGRQARGRAGEAQTAPGGEEAAASDYQGHLLQKR